MPQPSPEARYTNDLPSDISDALHAAGILPKFLSLPPSHRNEYVKWIEDAKKPDTRRRRIEQAVARLNQKQT